MPKVSLIGNSLAYCLNETRQRATDYRPGVTPEDVRAVSEKSVRQHETTRGRNAPFDCRRTQAAVPGAVTVPPASRQRRPAGLNGAGSSSSRKGYPTSAARRWPCAALVWCKPVRMIFLRPRREPAAESLARPAAARDRSVKLIRTYLKIA
jgi:hypothetical protein